MHTADELDGSDFEYRADAEVVPRDAVMPHITPTDRVGVVMGTGSDGLGAGTFVLSCVTAFYDRLRETREDFFEYPDYYTFQTTPDPADYAMLDIYPDHKNVAVEADAERLLRAITDRAITILLVPDVPARSPGFEDITLRSAHRVLEDSFVYAPDGRPSESDFSISLPRRPAEEWFESTAHSVDSVAESETSTSFGVSDSQIVQHFRRVSLEQALSHLPPESQES